jgi:hypothetical protein
VFEMTDRDSEAWRRTDATTTRRLWARGVQTMFAGSRELAHASDETVRSATSTPGRRRAVIDIAPRGAQTPEPNSAPTYDVEGADAFDDFLATFEPDLPLTH